MLYQGILLYERQQVVVVVVADHRYGMSLIPQSGMQRLPEITQQTMGFLKVLPSEGKIQKFTWEGKKTQEL